VRYLPGCRTSSPCSQMDNVSGLYTQTMVVSTQATKCKPCCTPMASHMRCRLPTPCSTMELLSDSTAPLLRWCGQCCSCLNCLAHSGLRPLQLPCMCTITHPLVPTAIAPLMSYSMTLHPPWVTCTCSEPMHIYCSQTTSMISSMHGAPSPSTWDPRTTPQSITCGSPVHAPPQCHMMLCLSLS
jgi:hypothetical protein